MNNLISKIKETIENFKGLNPKEFYDWPFNVKVVLGGVVLLLILGLGVLLDIQPLNEKLDSVIKKEEKLKKEFIDKKRQAVNLELYQEQLEFVTKDSNNLLKQLPDRSQMEKLLIDINQAAISRGLSVELFKPNQEKVKEFYAELPIDIRVVGSYEAIGKFTADVSQLSRVVIFSNMEINLEKTNQISLLALIKTFRYLDQEELDAQARKLAEEKKKAKKGRAKTSSNKKEGEK